MKSIVLPILFLSLVALADQPTLVESAMVEYGFSEWPVSVSTNLVSDSWEPSLQWPLEEGTVVETNRESDILEYSVVRKRRIVAETRVERFETAEAARVGLLNYLALCTSPEPLLLATNAWNQAGERCYVDNPSTTNSIILFYRKNVFVSVFSRVNWLGANSIAQEIDGELVAEE